MAAQRAREAAAAEAKRTLDGDVRSKRETSLKLGAARAARIQKSRRQRVGLVIVVFAARAARLRATIVSHHAYVAKIFCVIRIQAAMRGAMQRKFVERLRGLKTAMRRTIALWRFHVRRTLPRQQPQR
jgi:hypothetical protein